MRLALFWMLVSVFGLQLGSGCVDVLPATSDQGQNNADGTDGGNTGDGSGNTGNDSTGNTGNGGGMDGGGMPPATGGGSFDGSIAVPDAEVVSDASANDAALPQTLDCESYCETIQSACTGNFSQYDTLEECLSMCDDMPPGALDDASGDSVGCRLYHAQNAMKQARPEVHCPHAGPTGGGVCGSRCEALCDRATKLCTDDRGYPEAYSSREDCMTICQQTDAGLGGYKVDAAKELPASGNTVNCRIYHLRNAYTRLSDTDKINDSAGVHCRHVGQISPTCL
jgi:hypothetical protein